MWTTFRAVLLTRMNFSGCGIEALTKQTVKFVRYIFEHKRLCFVDVFFHFVIVNFSS